MFGGDLEHQASVTMVWFVSRRERVFKVTATVCYQTI